MIETVVKESAILQYLPFLPVTGTSVRYNREATMPAASFYSVGDTWSEASPTFSEQTASLKILGGDADVDNFLQSTYADTNDIEAEVIASRAKAVATLLIGVQDPHTGVEPDISLANRTSISTMV